MCKINCSGGCADCSPEENMTDDELWATWCLLCDEEFAGESIFLVEQELRNRGLLKGVEHV